MSEYYSEAEKQNDYDELKRFLLDVDCLDVLDEWVSQFNLFDVLKIARTEIRHSNVLAWLLDPNENHGFGDYILRGFLRYVVSSHCLNADVFTSLLMDCQDFAVQREWHNIDIIAVSQSQRFVLCIENKIDSGEHGNQLERYFNQVNLLYPDYNKVFIFLTPDGIISSDPDNWCSMGYRNVLDIIDSACRKYQILPEVKLLIDNYTNIIRRYIVEDVKLEQICKEIYSKHKRALDLIYEFIPDRASKVAEILHEWCKKKTEEGVLQFVPEKSGKKYTRFKTATMTEILPDAYEPNSGWNTKNYYFYEMSYVINKKGEESIRMSCVLSSKDIPSDLEKKCNQIRNILNKCSKGDKWQYCAIFSKTTEKFDSETDDDSLRNKIFKGLDKCLEKMFSEEKKLLKELAEIDK